MPYPFFNAFVIAFLIATTLMLVLRPIAFALRLVDVPGGRKTHAGEVPVIGGVAMFMAVCASVSSVGVGGPGTVALAGRLGPDRPGRGAG